MAYYRITCDGHVVMDTRLDGYSVMSPKCTLELNTTGTLTFDLDPTHPCYNLIDKVSSVITLYEGEQVIFQGRCMDDEIAFDKVKTIECEGELAYLLDSVVRPYSYSGGVRDLVKQYLDSHNQQVEKKKRFALGSVTVTDPNDYITRAASAYPNTWDEMNDKLIDLLGGYLRLRWTAEGTYLDYIESYGNVNQQVIDFGSNLLDLKQYIKGEDVATRIIPLGATIESETEDGEVSTSEEGTEKRVTIESVNGGLDYVEDAEAVERYGLITKVVTHDGITLPDNLLTAAYKDLEAQKMLQVTLEITALDLHLLDVDVERIKVGDMIKVRSKPHGIDEYMLVSKIEMDLDNPSNTVVTLGETFATFTNETKGVDKVAEEVAQIKGDYVSGEVLQGRINEVYTSVESQIEQSSADIVSSVSSSYASKTELESLNEELSSQISQTTEDITATFDRATLYTEQVEGEMRADYERIQTVYRINEDGAEIGKSDSPFKVRVDNEELGFYENGQRIAYINNKRMYETDVEVSNVLTIGNSENGYWDWLPRENGNLSLKWRGGTQ